jgi:transcriptional regulator GlxA family with amidase domain
VRRLRLAEARRLLEETNLPLKDVTERAGLGDQTTLWRVFMHDLGLSPAEYRQRFSPRADPRCRDVWTANDLLKKPPAPSREGEVG